MGTLLGAVPAAAADIPAGYTAVSTPQQLSDIRNNLSGKYILTDDIELSTWGNWEPIGDYNTRFQGVFDGNGHVVKNMTVNVTSERQICAGLFGGINGAEIKNLGIVGGSITATSTNTNTLSSASSSAGGIVGVVFNDKASKITNCYNSSNVTAVSSVYSQANAGGIAGFLTSPISASNQSTISRCWNLGNVTASSPVVAGDRGGVACAGGITGGMNSSKITDCHNMGSIYASSNWDLSKTAIAGGIVGTVNVGASNVTIISNCYNAGAIDASAPQGASIGALAGARSSLDITQSYYLNTTAREGVASYGALPTRVEVTALSDLQMRQQASFVGFDFVDVWQMPAGGGYPVLRGMPGQGSGTTEPPATPEKAIFPMANLRIAQDIGGDYSHKGTMAIDCSGAVDNGLNNGGRDDVFAPFTGIIKRIYTDYGNVVWLESKDKVQYADGTIDYMTVLFMHDNDVSNLSVGQTIRQGDVFYQEGNAGVGGVHLHIECGRGKFYTDYNGWFHNGNYFDGIKIYEISATGSPDDNTLTPWDALFVDTNKTTVLDGSNKPWKDLNGNLVSNGGSQPTTYTLTINPNGGSVSPTSQTGTQGQTYALPTPTRSGYTFTGWTLSGGGSLNGNTYTFSSSNGAVTAGWTLNSTPNPDPPTRGFWGTASRWTGEWWHYVLFFLGGFLWMWF